MMAFHPHHPGSEIRFLVLSNMHALEETQLILIVADEHVLGLAVTVQHHLVSLSAEAYNGKGGV